MKPLDAHARTRMLSAGMTPSSRRRLLWFSLPVLLLTVAVWHWQLREPEWEGQPLGHWLETLAVSWDDLYAEPTKPGELAAYRAIRGMGTNAVPSLLRRMSHPTPAPWERQVMRVKDFLEARHIRYPWRRVSRYTYLKEAALLRAFFALGTVADPFVPELARRLNSTNSTEAFRAAHVLARIGPHGVQAVVAATTNSVPEAREAAVFGLSVAVTNRSEGFAVILALRRDASPVVRSAVAKSLRSFQDRPVEAIPALIELLSDPELDVRRLSVQSLGGFFKSDLSAAVPALTKLKADPDKWTSQKASDLLDTIASLAKAASISTRTSPKP